MDIGPPVLLSVRGDSGISSGLEGGGFGTSWQPVTVRGDSLGIGGPDWSWLATSFDGDTLVVSPAGDSPRRYRLVRLQPSGRARRPERIALSMGGCFSDCFNLEFEVDSSGAVHLYQDRPAEDGEDRVRTMEPDRPTRPSGSYAGAGHQALFRYLSERAVTLHADSTPPEPEYGTHEPVVDVALWYDGEFRVHRLSMLDGSLVWGLASELYYVARHTPMEPTPERYPFRYSCCGSPDR